MRDKNTYHSITAAAGSWWPALLLFPAFILANRIVTALIRKHLCSDVPSRVPGMPVLTKLSSPQGEGMAQQKQTTCRHAGNYILGPHSQPTESETQGWDQQSEFYPTPQMTLMCAEV